MDVITEKYVGAYSSRKQRYLGGIISLCKNFIYDVVCYTHQKSYEEVKKIKDEYSLDNLKIKIKELEDVKYHSDILRIEDIKTKEELEFLHGRPPRVMWGKFDFLEEECKDEIDYIYWIDAGLQYVGLFPMRLCKFISDSDCFLPPQHPFKQYDFGTVFNRNMIDKLTEKIENKFAILVSPNPQDGYHDFDDYVYKRCDYPIAGFFGGNKNVVLDFCKKFNEGVEKYVSNDLLAFEQPIMKYALDHFENEKVYKLEFHIHQSPLDFETFHNKVWDKSLNLQKPIFRIWEEIIEN
jgi:hypothetical protein